MGDVEAQALGYALEIGAAHPADASEWAYSQIALSAEPSRELLMLSTERKREEAISYLHVLGGQATGEEVGRVVYQWLLKALVNGSLSHRRAAEAVVRLVRESAAPGPEEESWYFDEAFRLADSGVYGNAAEVAAELEAHLTKYAA